LVELGAFAIGAASTEAYQQLNSAFKEWAEPWSRLGIWLSLWDEYTGLIDYSRQVGLFWQTLIQQSKRFEERLKHLVRQTMQGDTLFAELDRQQGLYVMAVPVFYRQRFIGAVLACGITKEFFDDEGFARFCTHHQMDRLLAERLISELPFHTLESLGAYAKILCHHVESFISSSLARRDNHDLSYQLARAYEELSLLFRISSDINVVKGPAVFFQKLCEQLLDSTIAESFVTVLEPPMGQLGKETVIKAGPVEMANEDLVSLYHEVRHQDRNAGNALVVNEAHCHPAFNLAGDWLRQFVYFDLSRNDRIYGGLFAINRFENEDFVSEQVQLLSTVVERSASKDPYTCGHSQRVAWLSQFIANLDGKPEDQCQRVYLSGLLHDIGKIGISESVLCKTGRLTPDEYKEMKRHPEIGARILGNVSQVEDLIPGVLHHHERMNGKGYPAGLQGDDVPYLGRVICLADSFDAMTSDRTYRSARPIQIAASEIRRYAGTQFDPRLAAVLLDEDMHDIRRKMAESGNQPFVSYNGASQPSPIGAAP